MDQAGNQEHELLLAQLEARAEGRLPAAQRELFRRFLRDYYEMSSLDALRQRTPAELLDIALDHWQFAQGRQPGEARVRALAPGDPAGTGRAALASIDTCTDDMPFLVDTVTMAVREAGVAIDWTVHPVLRLRRDAGGAITAVGEGADESLIHVEFEPLTAEGEAALARAVREALADLRSVVADFPALRERLRDLVRQLQTVPPGGDADEFAEARAFLQWLEAGHFTFLGYGETRTETRDGRTQFLPLPERALGLSRKGGRFEDPDELIAPREELDKYAASSRVVVVTKASQKSPVRHAETMDVISVKRYDASGAVAGTCRFIGLFSVEAYRAPPREIPLVRRKAAQVMQASQLPQDSHSGKHLRDILGGLPRDELFQSGEDELLQTCMGIRALRDRHPLRLFMRRDRYGRFYSCLVYLPRDRYSRELRDRIVQELRAACGGYAVEQTVDFPERLQARIHCIVRTAPGTRLALTAEDIERRLVAATRSWRDALADALSAARIDEAPPLLARFAEAFPLSYTERVAPQAAAADLPPLSRLSEAQPLLPRLRLDPSGAVAGLTLYAWRAPLALSDVLPALENFGLRVIRQEPTPVQPRDGTTLWIQDFDVGATAAAGAVTPTLQAAFEQAFLLCWNGAIENDGFNRLVLAAGLDARKVSGVRLIAKYLIQTGMPHSQAYVEQLLAEHAGIARLLVRLFETRFDPRIADAQRTGEEIKLAQELDAALDGVASLDGDRVLRAFLSVVRAGLRTNYFQRGADGAPKSYISLKLDPAQVPELPLPRPKFEIFVYAPEVEGVHLRGGKVARGGIRWSDRRQDFRTEVLGLMKAQMVKNTVIVPVGAKGGFVVKKPVDAANRDAWLAQGIACYRIFMRGLLDLTDNRVGGRIVPPPDVVRHDEDDPYLVVAADKGTATFSDIANGIAAEYGFWLGDAFASGGSAGYDHKKMGITARGAWESVKRHFREMEWTDAAGNLRKGRDIQSEPFTCAGIGDMSGDVFGNGLLLSRQTRLVAAFDHRHIFLDPDSDPARSFEERARLFALPRSSWADYDAALISPGGGVYPRSAKSVKLSAQVQRVLDVRDSVLTPAELIKAILRAPVDLLWNGGIGTYVKAAEQSHPDVGDRANDAVRVNGRELRCRVVGEGGNLGFTQLGRIEYALQGGPRTAAGAAGGRLNTDAIDNAAGVHTSDREVNIKIPLNSLMAEGRMTRMQRDALLAEMTDDVAGFVLRDNYVQSAAVTLLEHDAAARLDEHAGLIRTLERDGLLNRALEFLPDEDTLKERRSQGRGLTRPELSVLLAYSKISLNEAMLHSAVPDDPFFERDLLANFPPALVERQRGALVHHQLRREIIATMLTNAVVNRMGASFSHRMAEDHGVPRAEIIKAYAAAHQIYAGDRYWRAIEALDNRIDARLQCRLFERAGGLLKHATGWIVNTRAVRQPIGDLAQRFAPAVTAVEALLPEALPPGYREDWDRAVANAMQDGVPESLARMIANTRVLGTALDMAELAGEAGVPLAEAVAVYFQTGARFQMPWLHAAIVALRVASPWQALARTNLRDDAYRLHRLLAARVLRHPGADAAARIAAWEASDPARVQFALGRVLALQSGGSADFAGLVVAVRDLRKLRTL
ncbi:MAG: NAD-glutamate dehydrogenase [Nevskiaceae bacterium]|nr:MAG: NAD-glutamate dehydrogenase [Nevskiaceae bacterium]